MTRPRQLALLFVLALARPASAEGPSADEFFERSVRPVLAERCQGCHGGEKTKGGLALTSRAAVLAGGDSGPAAVPGKPDESLIVQAIRYADEPKMPPKARLTDAEVAALTRWVELGLPWPEAKAEATAAPAGKAFTITDEQRRYWAFQRVRDPAPPAVKDEGWIRNGVDRFILSALEAKGLVPAPAADRRTLIRRATFDLTGLPPTRAEVEAFVADESPDAFARVVDRLLASPAYGERWGRHWLDLARYADSRDARGIGGDSDIADAWRYRDWVVNAFNRDLPYDRFIVEQIAGDLLPSDGPGGFNADGLVATGLLTIGEWGTGDADKEKMMTDIVDDQIDVVGRTFLGLTIACARCHDHKFDPIAQDDYYGLAGVFFSTHILPDPGAKTNGSPMLRTPLLPRAELERLDRQKARTAELERLVKAESDAAFARLSRDLVPSTARYLQAAWESIGRSEGEALGEFAAARGLRADVLRRWANALGLGDPARPLANRVEKVRDLEGVVGWRLGEECPNATINGNDRDVPFLNFRLPPRSVTIHPGPTRPVAVTWRSPIAGRVQVAGRVADADPAGGDGVAWRLVHRRGRIAQELAGGEVDNGKGQALGDGRGADRLAGVDLQPGDTVSLVDLPRASHTCDTTLVGLTLTGPDGSESWDLARDVAGAPKGGNPHADASGRAGVWEFVEVTSTQAGARPASLAPLLGGWDRAIESGDPELIAQAGESVGWAVLHWPDENVRTALAGADGPFGIDDRGDLSGLPADVAGRLSTLRAELADLRRAPSGPLPTALAAQEGGVPRSPHEGIHDARIHVRGSYQRLGPIVPRHVPRILAGGEPLPIGSATTSGRLELARWIARPDHPTTARVMANRLWQYHFGAGIARTPSNFGKLGEPPTHPELLDWLASRFVDGGWSMKQMHRLLMKSAAYQQSSTPASETLRADPDNRLFGRMARRRLEAEEVRDALLAAAGRLGPAMGGPATQDFNAPRRTLYTMTIRSDRASFGPLFDAADSTALVDRRTVSTVAPQALFLLNNPFTLDAARALAGRVRREGPADDRGRIDWAYRFLYGRPPEDEEVAVGLSLLADDPETGWEAYAQALLCANEFFYVDCPRPAMIAPNRRQALRTFASGFGMLGLAALLDEEAQAEVAPPDVADPLAPRLPMYPARAKRVIFLFMSGGPSHVDTFDPKPRLDADNGKPLPFAMPHLERTRTGNLLRSPFKFDRHGEGGLAISELFPKLAKRADDLCVIRSMVADNINHNGACLQMNTGEQTFSRPSLGSWLTYGLGSENRDLPGFVVISPSQPAQGAPLWSSSFLPAAYQGTLISDLNDPIANLKNGRLGPDRQRRQLDALRQLNERHRIGREDDSRLAARIESFELAFRMQARAPEAFDVNRESAATRALYGLDDPATTIFGTQCLMARRLAERGVRFVQVYHTQTSKRKSCQLWDQHGGLKTELPNNCAATDGPIAGLLTDLKARGLLDDTLVVWGGEFGRTPTAEGTDGREHHPFGFTMWLAGGGVKGGLAHGATDEFGWHSVEDKVHVHDLHATILHLMGLDHTRLTYRYSGRDYRLTDVSGNVVQDILA